MNIEMVQRRNKLAKCGEVLETASYKVFEEWQAQLMKIATGVEYPMTSRFILPPETLYYILSKSKDDYASAFSVFIELMINNKFLLEE